MTAVWIADSIGGTPPMKNLDKLSMKVTFDSGQFKCSSAIEVKSTFSTLQETATAAEGHYG